MTNKHVQLRSYSTDRPIFVGPVIVTTTTHYISLDLISNLVLLQEYGYAFVRIRLKNICFGLKFAS